MKRILITGGAGFVGSSLALRLKAAYASAEVLCLDNLSRRGSELNRRRIEKAGVSFIRGDVRDRSSFDLRPCDLIIDAAAEASVMAGCGDDAGYVVDTNLGGTLNVLETTRKWACKLLFLSTSRIYPLDLLRSIAIRETGSRFEIADEQALPGIGADGIAEVFPKEGCRTLYGATKYASEIMAQEYARQFGLQILIDRCGVIAGPWQMGRVDQGIVALWVGAHCYRRKLAYIGYGGKQVRDALHIEDLADLILLQMGETPPWRGNVFNVGGGRDISFSLRELTAITEKATGESIGIDAIPEIREGDIPLFITDTSLVRSDYGWKPRRHLAEIVRDTMDWMRGNEEDLRELFLW